MSSPGWDPQLEALASEIGALSDQPNVGDLQSPKVVGEVAGDAEGRVLPPTGTKKKYKLVEIFNSVKGEGTQAGMPMTFIRFSKCNLDCSWCDTPYNRVAIEMPADQLVETVMANDPAWVVFTGGEPCLQLDYDLGIRFRNHGVRMAIETNGMIWPKGCHQNTPPIPGQTGDTMGLMNYINISPKYGQPIHKNWRDFRPPDEVRYTICDGQEDIWHVYEKRFVGGLPKPSHTWNDLTDIIGINAKAITISPAMEDLVPQPGFKSGEGFRSLYGKLDMASFNRCLHLVNQYRHAGARLSVQVHKFIGAR